MPRKSVRKDQLITWLNAQTDPDAWLTKTYQQIGDEMVEGEKVDASVVRGLLPMVVADRLGIEPSEVLKRKAEHRKVAQGYMTPDKLRLLKEWRTQDPPVPMIDCAHRLDMSLQTIIERCKEMGLM